MQSNQEKRNHPRRTTTIIASLKLDTGEEIPCVVRDVSAGGAKIGVLNRYNIPDKFHVVFLHNKRSMRVRLAWRKGNFIGVSIDVP